jgi:microcystin degradation protein MlrC
MLKRVLFAGLFHETHTFLEGSTALDHFTVTLGEEMMKCSGDSSPMGGALDCARAFGWDVIPAADFRATPGPMVEDEVVDAFSRELLSRVPPVLDGVYLVLHGAMVSPSFDDVEGEILERLRRIIGPDVPVFGVFDLHANFTQRMADHANCLVAYRENPHSDARHAAQSAASLLQRSLMTHQVPKMFWHHPPVLWPPTGTGTASEPMKSLEAAAREMESMREFWAVNVCAGFSFADTPEAGVSFVIASIGGATQALEALQNLSQLAISARESGNTTEAPVDEVLAKLGKSPNGLTVLVEPADNIGGGAPGDATGLLRALLKHEVKNAAICINDPLAVWHLRDVEPSKKTTLTIGGRCSRLDPGPLELTVELLRRGEGRFALEDKRSHLASMCGDTFDMGPCAVVRHSGITILLTSHKTPPFDLGQWRSQGIEPRDLSVIGVKAAVAHRHAYDPIATQMLWVDTPGPCTSNLKSLPFQKVRRPIFPLDS